jgi:transposase-like protein
MVVTPPSAEDVDIRALISRFGSEDKCRAYLEELRWPDGPRCPRCNATKGISRIEKRGQFDCDSCGYQFSVRVGTVFHGSHLPLWKWFLAVYVMSQTQRGVSANRLSQMLGVSYKTAWYLCHRIRAAMKDEASERLRQVVQNQDAEPLDPAALAGYLGLWDENLRRDVVGSYHHLSAKHLPAYLDEMAFRHQNRKNAYSFRDTLLRLIEADSMSYTELISSA